MHSKKMAQWTNLFYFVQTIVKYSQENGKILFNLYLVMKIQAIVVTGKIVVQ